MRKYAHNFLNYFELNKLVKKNTKAMPRKRVQSQTKRTALQALSNVIGDRGEMVFELAITDYQYFHRPLFKPGFLGDKWPNVDYYVELKGVRNSTPFFLAQVKSTATSIDENATVLPIQASKEKCANLFKIPGPTYIVGVHEPTKRAFILSVHAKPQQGVYNIPLRYELNADNLRRLYQEVIEFWKAGPHKPSESYFI